MMQLIKLECKKNNGEYKTIYSLNLINGKWRFKYIEGEYTKWKKKQH